MKKKIQMKVIKLLDALESLRRNLMIHVVMKNKYVKQNDHVYAGIAFSISEDVQKFNKYLNEAKNLPVDGSFSNKTSFIRIEELDFSKYTSPVNTFANDENTANQIQNEIFYSYQKSLILLIHYLSIEYFVSYKFVPLKPFELAKKNNK